jgi:cutinase
MKFQLYGLISLLAFAIASPIPPSSSDLVDLSPEELARRQTPLNQFVTLLLNNLPAINGEISKVAGILTAFENLLAILTGAKTTYNDLQGSCKAYTVIFARGTTEPGNVGILVGPPFFEALKAKVGANNLAIQGVNNYKADIAGYLAGGEAAGSTSM